MLIRILSLILVALPVSPTRYEPTTRPPIDPAAIDTVVREYRDATGIPGVAVAVTHGGTVVHVAGYGRTGNGESVTDRTVLAVASVSKSITALAVMQLVDAGRVRLDEPVGAYLPEFVMADARAARITVRQLLNHTSGMSDTTYRSFSGPRLHTLQEAVASMRSAGLAADPGSRYEYHNPNYQVAARLVEVLSGMSFDSYLRARVFGPLGMADSRTGNTSNDLPASGRGHLVIAGQAIAVPEPPAFGNGSGGVLSTAHDVARWLIAQNGQGTMVVSAAALAEMHRAQAGSYALGWNTGRTRGGAPLIDHDGTMLTFTAYQALLPATGHGIAVMANTRTGATASDIGYALVDLVEGRPPTPPSRSAMWVDLVMLGLIPPAIVLTVRGVRRSRRWADRHRTRRRLLIAVMRLAPYSLPILLLATLDRVASFLYRGRDITWLQTAYLVPSFVLLLAALATTCGVLLTTRLWRLTRHRPGAADAAPCR